MGTIIAKQGLFTPCVESGVFELTGKTSHAAEPAKGINPALAIAEVISYFDTLNEPNKASDNFFLATPIHIEMGEKAYGTSAGKATIGYTFRSWENDKFDAKKIQIEQQTNKIAQKYQLSLNVTWLETFNANTNNAMAYLQIKSAAKSQKLEFLDLKNPFEFGEDFGLFTKKYKGAMFGIGSGINQAPLHSSKFDFPDELIEIGASMFCTAWRVVIQAPSAQTRGEISRTTLALAGGCSDPKPTGSAFSGSTAPLASRISNL